MIMRKPPSAPDAIGAPAKGGRGPFSCPKLTSVDGCRAHGLARLGDRYIALCRHAGSRLGAAAPDLVPAGGIGVGRGAAGRLDRGADTAIQYPHIGRVPEIRSEEHTSELPSLMRIPYAVFCLKKTRKQQKD